MSNGFSLLYSFFSRIFRFFYVFNTLLLRLTECVGIAVNLFQSTDSYYSPMLLGVLAALLISAHL